MKTDRYSTAGRRVFAVANVGSSRWYWCVWPSQQEIKTGGGNSVLACGIEVSKLAAVDAALEHGGPNAHWALAKYARQQYMTRGTEVGGAPAAVAWLYRDAFDECASVWRSERHRIVKITSHYIFIDPLPEAQRGIEDSHSWQRPAAVRVARTAIEKQGYAAVSVAVTERFGYDEPFFFSTPVTERMQASEHSVADCFSILGVPNGATCAEMRAAYRRLVKCVHPDRGGTPTAFVALQQAYQQAIALSEQWNDDK